MISIRRTANEQGTCLLVSTFTNEKKAPVTPTGFKWTLKAPGGEIINGRERVAVVPIANKVSVVLSGDDLQVLESEREEERVTRYFVVEATFTSDLGVDLPATEAGVFEIINLPYIEGPA